MAKAKEEPEELDAGQLAEAEQARVQAALDDAEAEAIKVRKAAEKEAEA